jgi:hypothetical protein
VSGAHPLARNLEQAPPLRHIITLEVLRDRIAIDSKEIRNMVQRPTQYVPASTHFIIRFCPLIRRRINR